jgi:putative cardiolipin synthase
LRVLSARAAVRCLDLQYYIWHSDATGRYLAHEALLAADRGVRVRLLLDDMDARSRDDLLMALDQHPLIEIRLFNPFATRSGALRTMRELLSRGSRLNHRMHNKAWIADGRMALVGGRNIGDEYFAASSQVNFVDLDVLLAGPAVAETTRIFDQYWNSESAVPIARLRRTGRNRHSLDEVRGLLSAAVRGQDEGAYISRLRETPHIHDLVNGDYHVAWSSQVQVVADDPRKALKRPEEIDPGVLQSISSAFDRAGRELQLISPYFVPGEGGAAQLERKAREGCAVAVLTNSLAATDVAAVHSGYAKYRPQLLVAGVKLFELKPAPEEDDRPGDDHPGMRLRIGSSKASLHTKAAIIDGERVFVGSFNLDPRSATLNCEMGVWIADATIAQQLQTMFATGATPQRSFVLSLDDRGHLAWTESLAQRTIAHRTDPYAGWGRRFLTWLLRHLPIESQL